MGGWFVADCRCRICCHEHLAVFPEECDEDNMECNACGNMTAEAFRYYKKEEQWVKDLEKQMGWD